MLKQQFHAFAMCQSMFCAFPFPFKIWDEDARGRMLVYLPVVGLEIGLVWAFLGWFCGRINLAPLIRGAVLCAYPFLATGFIHLDGFMDVTDAVKSWRDLERRREILKDSHVGSFAVIAIGLLMVTQFALLSSLKPEAEIGTLILIPVISRCCSGLAVSILPVMHTSEYAGQKKPKAQILILGACVLISLVAGFLFWGKYGLVLLGGIGGHSIALHRAYRSLEGMNGDISGYALTYSELAAIAVLACI